MAKRGPRHHRDRHRTNRPAGPGVDSSAGGNEVKRRERRQKEADRHERVGNMEDQDEPVRRSPVTGPANEAGDVERAGYPERARNKTARRVHAPCDHGADAGDHRDCIETTEGDG